VNSFVLFIINKEFLGAIGVTLALIGQLPYLWGIWTGQVRPHLYSWILWTILTSIAAMAQLLNGAGAGSWSTIASVLFCIIVLGVAWKQADKDITRSDKLALVMGLTAIPVWFITGAFWAVLLATFTALIGYWPTVRKCWNRPWIETISSNVIANVRCFVSFGAMQSYSFSTLVYPLGLVAANTILIVVMLYRRQSTPLITKTLRTEVQILARKSKSTKSVKLSAISPSKNSSPWARCCAKPKLTQATPNTPSPPYGSSCSPAPASAKFLN
jgi:hypothetical protein